MANQSTQALFDGEVFLGLQKPLTQTLQVQIGLAVAATSNANLSGMIWDDADPSFNNYTYSYQLQHQGLFMTRNKPIIIPSFFSQQAA